MNIFNASKEKWIETWGSGTLQYAYKYNCAIDKLYLEERVAFIFGGAFQIAPKSKINFGIPLAESNCFPFTEGLWQIRRRKIMVITPDYTYSDPKWIIHYNSNDDIEQQGLGLIIENCTYEWIPKGNIIFAIVSSYKDKKYSNEILNL